MIAGCEALDGRQLLSTMAASPAELSAPSATAVAAAAANLSALDPSGFARLEGELAQAESDSQVSAAEAGKLAQDEATLDRAIETLGQGHVTPSLLRMNVQNVNDEIGRHAFMGDTVAASQDFIANLRGAAQKPVAWRQLRAALSGVSIPPSLVGQTTHQMQVIARATHLPHQLVDAFWIEYNTLNHELPTNAEANLGPGAADLGAVQVYLDGQINSFIKS